LHHIQNEKEQALIIISRMYSRESEEIQDAIYEDMGYKELED